MGQEQPILGIVAPHPPIMLETVGGARSRVTADSLEAMSHCARILERFEPDTIVVMSPHSPALADSFAIETSSRLSGSLARFGAPEATHGAETDHDLAYAILDALESAEVPACERSSAQRLAPGVLDHGVLVPLAFLDPDGAHPLVVLSLSGLSLEAHRHAGSCVASAAASLGRRIAFIASGDLSHRLTPEAPAGFSRRAREFDDAVVGAFASSELDSLASLDPGLIAEAGECGLRSFVTLSGVIPGATAEVLAYEAPWGVGYLTAVITESHPDALFGPTTSVSSPDGTTPSSGRKGGAAGQDGHPIVALARASIEAHVRGEEPPPTSVVLDERLPARAGTFVTLHRQGSLRGCIGTIAPTMTTLAEEVVANAVKAATSDPRFPPLEVEELLDLDVKVDVLHAPEPATGADLDPASFGVIVTRGWKRGLLLPDLEGVDTPEQQIAIACRKAGLDPEGPFELERFRVDRYA